MQADLLGIFKEKKPVIGEIQLKGTALDNVMVRAKHEIQIYQKHGVDGILIKNDCGHYNQVEAVLDYINTIGVDCPVGVNVLELSALSFHLAEKYNLDFIQIDSVVGHVKPRDEHSLQAFFELYREYFQKPVIGGVRFAKQPVLSTKPLAADLQTAMSRCDGIAVTSNTEGKQTFNEKMHAFRDAVGDFPLILNEMSIDDFKQYITIGDAAIIGNFFKDPQKPSGNINEAYVKEFMDVARAYRAHAYA